MSNNEAAGCIVVKGNSTAVIGKKTVLLVNFVDHKKILSLLIELLQKLQPILFLFPDTMTKLTNDVVQAVKAKEECHIKLR